MKTQFKRGHIYGLIQNNKTINNKREYYIVMQEESVSKRIVFPVVNSNKRYPTGVEFIPIDPEIYYEEVEICASDLVHEQIMIEESLYNYLVTDKVISVFVEEFKFPFPEGGITKKNEISVSFNLKYDTKLLWKIGIQITPKSNTLLHLSIS